ncbi:rdgB/HAM1 family non-canonical purine NTP pyrophosphatase [Oribacterium parvum ACB1]|jgi:non-canonical purine NTP pyrophosphatase, rdgB/HAM1 family|uniref:dITP/XTP pyrophosphatase n=2 Tax=Oribacterium parvum TaxID=1501329 RepID=G9WLP0_9FIRM|nr:RdgB/HAM1 family non-canonical purine NTP pyrophosphatase [Oribacterium parvum]EHL12695.1 rdgB/HAM1 family non-canonical purine NTP pyrophosphatase [Oribacterium parvum ACB1]EJF12450.1 non-canonical purine NTP pyrophosphatase, RdgB/HAM1 family [Oribacterium parvum ACB8]MBF1269251.1 RdgB/HAM1 family non-canonical purine NTP pyrophosphatase [Oribacterium parvum]
MRIIFATHNEDKLREIREILREFPGEIISKKEIGEWEDAVEDGSSFLENAEIKAYDLYVRLKKKELLQDGDIIMADDSGLSIEALSFGPGIYSARFLGENTPYPEKNKRILEMMKEASSKSRYAYFTCAIVAVLSDGRSLKTEARCEGEIAKEIRGEAGFGYDPIFFIPECGKTAAELSEEEKNKVSHRGKALRKMERILKEEIAKSKKTAEEKKSKSKNSAERKKEEHSASDFKGEKKILVVSDNHRKLDNIYQLLEENPDISYFIHLGDSEGSEDAIRTHLPKGCESYFVQGNNDFFAYLPKEIEMRLGKERLFLTHGHLYGVGFDLQGLADEARARNCSMALFGHTHRPFSRMVNGVLCINPGSINFPRQENRKPSYAMFYLDKKGNLRTEAKYI